MKPRLKFRWLWCLLALAIFAALIGVPTLLREHTTKPLGDRPEHYMIWGLVSTSQLLAWGFTLLFVMRDDIRAAWRGCRGQFLGFGLTMAATLIWISVLPLFVPDVMPEAWPLDFAALLGREMTGLLTLFVVVGALAGGALIGVVGSQFGELDAEKKSFADLTLILGRLRRSFLCLSVLLSMAVFSTARFYAGIRATAPSAPNTPNKYAFTSDIVLNYGLIMSFLLVLFYLPVALRYHSRAQAVLASNREAQEKKGGFDKGLTEELVQMQHAMGLTAASGVEGLVGALGPLLGAVLSLSSAR